MARLMALLSANDYANFWYYEIGVNVIPANSKNKVTLFQWKEDPRGNWQEVPIPLEIFEEWKRQDKFKDGIAVICGKVFRGENKDKWLNGIDCDNKLGLDLMCPNGIENIASITVVEQHANKEKCHIYFYTDEPIKFKVANDGKNGTVPQIEIKSGGKAILYCAGSIHKDGSPIEIIGVDRIKTLDKESLEIKIDDICKEYNIPYLNGTPENLKPVSELIKEDCILHEGENRSLAIVRYLDSKKIHNPEFDETVLFNLGMKFNLDHCKPPYDDKKIRGLAKQSNGFGEKKLAEKEEKQESKTEEEKQTANKKTSFTVSRKSKNYSIQVLTHEIQSIRPITLLEDRTRMILVYLPAKVQEIYKDDNLGESNFENKAFFVINGSEKKYLPADHPSLKENYKINISPSNDNVRWNLADLNQWLEETEKSNPKGLYDLQQSQTEKYLDFEHENDYVYFNLWNIATYFYELFGAFPYNDYTGTKRAGKTKALEFQSHVCFNAILTADISGSSLFRTIEGTGATVLLDETEAFKNQKNEQAQQVRTLLLEGFLKDKFAIRTEGSSNNGFDVASFNLYSPKSMGHISTLDDVLQDRCIELLMLRSKNKNKLNTWPTKRDTNFVKIRNLCYRLFLDYGDEIFDLQEEARNLLNVSGRELQVWTPIITMASFFDKHGCKFLINSIQEKITKTSGERQTTDEQGNKELKVLKFIDEKILPVVKGVVGQKKNQIGWIIITEIYKRLADGDTAKEYEINLDFYKQKQLREDLHRIGFKQERKEGGFSWEITDETVKSAKERLGMLEPSQKTMDDPK